MAKTEIARDVFTVLKDGDGWAVEHNGSVSRATTSKEEATASAHKMARAAIEAGRPAMVTVSGDAGYFQVRRAEPAQAGA